jgi:hypothetical protein
LARHCEPLSDEDVEIHDGGPCTSLARTTFDVVRVVPRETAVAFADAALRKVAVEGRTYDVDAAEHWRLGMLERVGRARGARGIRQAEEVIRFADGRAELPGESVTRLQLHRLGVRDFGLQIPVAGPRGANYSSISRSRSRARSWSSTVRASTWTRRCAPVARSRRCSWMRSAGRTGYAV